MLNVTQVSVTMTKASRRLIVVGLGLELVDALAIGYHREGKNCEADGARHECCEHACGDATADLVGEVAVYLQEHPDTHYEACDAGDGGVGLCIGAEPPVPDALAHAGDPQVGAHHHEHDQLSDGAVEVRAKRCVLHEQRG